MGSTGVVSYYSNTLMASQQFNSELAVYIILIFVVNDY